MAAITNVLTRLIGRGRPPTASAEVSFQSTLASHVAGDLSDRLGTSCDLIDFHATRTGSLTIRVRADRPYIAKLPLKATTGPRLQHNAQTLKALRQLGWATPSLSALCPEFVLTGTVSGNFYTVETTVPGRDGASILKSGGAPDAMIASAERYLAELQKASMVGTDGPHSVHWKEPFESAIARVAGLAAQAGAAAPYEQLVCDITNRLTSQPLPSVYAHGNFWLGNALFDAAGTLTGVIDWDCSAEFSLPATDFIYLLVRTHSLASAFSFGEGLADWIDAESLPFLDACIMHHCAELSIPTQLIAPLSYCSWILHLDAHCRYGTATSTSPKWLDRNVRHVLNRWQRRTATNGCPAYRWNAVDIRGIGQQEVSVVRH